MMKSVLTDGVATIPIGVALFAKRLRGHSVNQGITIWSCQKVSLTTSNRAALESLVAN
jgi:hypothetical protein